MKFDIKEEFYIDDQPIRLISGAVHYYRLAPSEWQMTLQNLVALGANCVETYVPWNLHEPKKGAFCFTGIADITSFLTMAQDLGLYIILRPSPYICAEWDFGGLPAWLLADDSMRIRSQHAGYLKAIEAYYAVLLPKLVPYQLTKGGKLLMVQVENEYGSFGTDQQYLSWLAGVLATYFDVPLFTSDGGVEKLLEGGTSSDNQILATVNFGSDASGQFAALRAYQHRRGIDRPLMCMEFWDGWFSNWGKPIIRRDATETAAEVRKTLKQGSINLYMFRGGTNFGFYNGCSDAGDINDPQITSYDYDALLTEWGTPTEKYDAIQKVIQEEVSSADTKAPILPNIVAFDTQPVHDAVSLFSVIDEMCVPVRNDYSLPMEKLGQQFGYLLYRTVLKKTASHSTLKIVEGGDRIQWYLDHERVATQYQEQIGESVSLHLSKPYSQLDLLVENMGRNNYGPKLIAPTQRKGIRGGVLDDNQYLSDWQHYSLELSPEQLQKIDFGKETLSGTPCFYRIWIHLDKPENTFLDCRTLGKGVVFVNGHHIGRYWQGPVRHLYAPAYFWQQGDNEVIVFETEGIQVTELTFSQTPIIE
ncbi:glycoside hydrolase family 35 protein [Enterococcus sp. RIT-PI-f]|uniref:glycoside hydrolase family 35 protein n=1 Tax=Enterococcus sp. RIT-PI-f TaxID=1690244 RepID=UPI0006B90D0B|nr:beta-galactosidase family protein [Enterococcus sp. RIT-PI-f]KPG70583.1 beta-galactosidase [Enterococcus sp. RIT-PI-f]